MLNDSTKCVSKVVFIDVVPDFEVAMSGCIDKKFARVFKQQQTHHIALFTKVDERPNPERYKVGVKQQLRRYHADHVSHLERVKGIVLPGQLGKIIPHLDLELL